MRGDAFFGACVRRPRPSTPVSAQSERVEEVIRHVGEEEENEMP